MIDYILDNMVVNLRKTHKYARKLRDKNILEYTICEEIAFEQRLSPDVYRNEIKNDAKPLSLICDFNLLAEITNEMIDHGVLNLDEGGGDVMLSYEVSAICPPTLFISERIIVSDDKGVQDYCDRHSQKWISSSAYKDELYSY